MSKLSRIVARSIIPVATAFAALSCGESTKPNTPGAAPHIITSPRTIQGDVPLPYSTTTVLSGDSLGPSIQATLRGQQFSIPITGPGTYIHNDTLRTLTTDTLHLMIESVNGRKDTTSVIITGTNTAPSITSKSFSKDSVAVGDSGIVRVIANDTRPGFNVQANIGSTGATSTSTGTADTVNLWFKPTNPGNQYAVFTATDPQGATAKDSLLVKAFAEAPTGTLNIPIKADTLPFRPLIQAHFSQPHIAFDSAKITINGPQNFSQRFTLNSRDTTLIYQPTLTQIGVYTGEATGYHRFGAVHLPIQLEGLRVANLAPVVAANALDTLVNAGTPAHYSIPATDDRGIDSLDVWRLQGTDSTRLTSFNLNKTKDTTISYQALFAAHTRPAILVHAFDMDGAKSRATSTSTYINGGPVVTSVQAPASIEFRPSRTIDVGFTATADSGLSLEQCIATTNQGFSDSSLTQFHLQFNNPSHTLDTTTDTGNIVCRDNNGMLSQPAGFHTMTQHSHPVTLETWNIPTDSLTERYVIMNNDTLFTQNGRITFYTRQDPTLSDAHTRWAGVRVNRHWFASTKISGENVTVPITSDTMTLRMGSLSYADSSIADSLSQYTTLSRNGWVLGGFADTTSIDTTKAGALIPVVEFTGLSVPTDSIRNMVKQAFDLVGNMTATPDSFRIGFKWGATPRPHETYIEAVWQNNLRGWGITHDSTYVTPIYGGAKDQIRLHSIPNPTQEGDCWPLLQALAAGPARGIIVGGIYFYPNQDLWNNAFTYTAMNCQPTPIIRKIPRALAYLGPGYRFKN